MTVDGEKIGVLRFDRLPNELPVRWKPLKDGRQVRRYAFPEYLESLGLDLADIDYVEFEGARRRAVRVDGSELVRFKTKLLFSFTQGVKGKVRFHWPADIRINTTIDLASAVHVHTRRSSVQRN